MNITNNYFRQQTSRIKGEWAALIICALVIMGTISHIFAYVAFALSVFALFFLSEEDRLCFVALLMPFANVFKSAPGAQSFFTYLLIVYVLYGLLQKPKMKASFLMSFLLLCAFVVLQMHANMDILKAIKFLVFVLFIYVAIGAKTTNDHRKVFLFYILGVIISSLVASLNIIPNLTDYVEEVALGGANNDEARFTGLYPDPNYYTVNVIISLCLVVILNHKKQLGTRPALLLAVPLVVFAIMTYSKSAFLMLLLPVVLLLYSRMKRKNHFVFLVLMIVVGLVLFGIFSGQFEAFAVVLERFGSDGNADDVTTGRYSIWMNYLNHLSDINVYTFIGAGMGAEYLNGRAAHNTYIDLMYYLGVIGIVILFVTIFNASKQKKTPPKRNLLNYGGWFCVIPMYFFLSELFFFDCPFHILMTLLIYKTDMQSVEVMQS